MIDRIYFLLRVIDGNAHITQCIRISDSMYALSAEKVYPCEAMEADMRKRGAGVFMRLFIGTNYSYRIINTGVNFAINRKLLDDLSLEENNMIFEYIHGEVSLIERVKAENREVVMRVFAANVKGANVFAPFRSEADISTHNKIQTIETLKEINMPLIHILELSGVQGQISEYYGAVYGAASSSNVRRCLTKAQAIAALREIHRRGILLLNNEAFADLANYGKFNIQFASFDESRFQSDGTVTIKRLVSMLWRECACKNATMSKLCGDIDHTCAMRTYKLASMYDIMLLHECYGSDIASVLEKHFDAIMNDHLLPIDYFCS